MNKVHFVSLFGVDLDMDLLPHWAAWYRRYNFDCYYVYLQSDKILTEHDRQAYRKIFEKYGFNSSWVPDAFQYARVRLRYLSAYHNSLPYGDYLVTADSDEIQGVPFDYRERIKKHEVMTGRLIDRYAPGQLRQAGENISLFEQYPVSGDVKGEVYRDEPGGIYQPDTRKILAARSTVDVAYAGSHEVIGGPYDTYGDFPVWHFSWRYNAIDRMAGKKYYKADNLFRVARFFGLDWHPAIDRKIAEMENLQKEMGWIAA